MGPLLSCLSPSDFLGSCFIGFGPGLGLLPPTKISFEPFDKFDLIPSCGGAKSSASVVWSLEWDFLGSLAAPTSPSRPPIMGSCSAGRFSPPPLSLRPLGDRNTCMPLPVLFPLADLGVFEANCSSTLKSSSSIKSRSAMWTASRLGSLLPLRCGTRDLMGLDGVSFNMGTPLGFLSLSFGDANTSFKFTGVFVLVFVPLLALDDANGEMQMIFEMPFCARLLALSPCPFGVKLSLPRGRLATSEKKKDVLTVGVLGVRGACGVFMIDP